MSRILLLLALAAASYIGLALAAPDAQAAQFCAFPNGSWQLCDEGRAMAECASGLSRAREEVARLGGGAQVTDACAKAMNGTVPIFECSFKGYAAGSRAPCPGHESIASGYAAENTCEGRKDYNGAFPNGQYKPRSGSMSCDLGCEVVWTHNADGTVNGRPFGGTCTGDDFDSDEDCAAKNPGSYYNRQVGVCEPKEPECKNGGKPNSLGQCAPEPCPDGMALQADGTCRKKDNECPAGNVRSPDGKCLPGEGQCAAGEVRGPDGTCKRDSDNDGEPDEQGPDDKEFFSGGDECNAPPSCSGSPIMCGMARIQWRIDCNTRKNRNIAGGTCAATPVCTGEHCDALEYSQLLMQWRTACALEKNAQGGGDSGLKDHLTAMKQAEVNALRALGQSDGHADVDPSKVFRDIVPDGEVKQGMFGGGGGQCSLSFTIGGRVVALPPQFWTVANLIRWLMIASAYLWVAIKLSR
ncbi:hypothetical protein [Stenotrophomonas sp.]|uniref:hypothetical protein n=1 Tax=Stenotrophomonas sp. TaxID=69392 RepID=UPI0028B1BD48|nr:hypothetical protein [Stenotrophomonas sp.]